MGVSINIKMSETILKNRGVKDCGAVQRKLDSDVLNYCSGFVPRRSGALINSGYKGTKIGSGVICYSSPYARYQYYGVSKKGKALHYHGGGQRGSFWFDRMKATKKYSLLKDAAIAAGGKADTSKNSNSKSKKKTVRKSTDPNSRVSLAISKYRKKLGW